MSSSPKTLLERKFLSVRFFPPPPVASIPGSNPQSHR